jgi:tetratricopeptide (TPR) repeat protein
LAWTLDCLGDLLCRIQEFEEAEQVLSRCLEVKIAALGEHHSTVAISISNLARLHYGRKNYSQAESLLLDSLRIYERVLGEQHPETASALYNLAMIYHQQGQFNAAEGVYNRCWQIRKNTLGPDHPDTKKVFDNYSKVLAAKAQIAPPPVPAAPAVPVKPVPASGLIRSTPVSKNEPVRTGVGEITGSWKVLQLPDELSLRADDN